MRIAVRIVTPPQTNGFRSRRGDQDQNRRGKNHRAHEPRAHRPQEKRNRGQPQRRVQV